MIDNLLTGEEESGSDRVVVISVISNNSINLGDEQGRCQKKNICVKLLLTIKKQVKISATYNENSGPREANTHTTYLWHAKYKHITVHMVDKPELC